MATINFQPQPATARQIYETAYRNARCARSLDARATITRIMEIDPVKRQRVLGIISWAQEAVLNRNEPMMAWFCITYENRFKLGKERLGKAAKVETVIDRKLVKKSQPSTAHTRWVDYCPMGTTCIERPHGWITWDLKKVSAASRNRLHRLIVEQGGMGMYKVGYNTRIYTFS